jgi:HD-GYP domain-containing protein (c-di-GMP phosphodiesterase class II)
MCEEAKMTTPLANPDVEQYRRVKSIQELENALEIEFDVWVRADGLWQLSTDDALSKYDGVLENEILENAWKSQQTTIEETNSGHYLIVIPKRDLNRRQSYALTSLVETENPKVLLYALQQNEQVSQHEEELGRLREENSAFLRQVSEDFEELTFLRSMAEHLTLEESNQALTRLTDYTLSLLGQIVGVEHLYFLDAREGQPHVKAAWSETASEIPAFEPWQLESLTRDLSQVMGDRPLVRNSINPEDLGYGLTGIKELAIVPVSSTIAQIGWLLAINRSGRQAALCAEVGWKLSQHELGTREASLLCTAAAMLASHANNLALLEERENLLVSVVRTLVSAVDSRDPYTCGHSERVALYAKRLAQEIGLADDECEKIYLTGLLHDLGKIGISDSVLKKCGPLTNEEFAEIQKHPDLGWAILQELEQFAYVLPGVLHHHERYDGKGYPDNLQGEETPLEGRLLAVVDSFDAMTSDRPYRAGMPVEKAIEILGEGAGTQWDSRMIDAFLRILPDIMEIRGEYRRPPLPSRKSSAANAWQASLAGSTAE